MRVRGRKSLQQMFRFEVLLRSMTQAQVMVIRARSLVEGATRVVMVPSSVFASLQSAVLTYTKFCTDSATVGNTWQHRHNTELLTFP